MNNCIKPKRRKKLRRYNAYKDRLRRQRWLQNRNKCNPYYYEFDNFVVNDIGEIVVEITF